jgi:hypothetical protein
MSWFTFASSGGIRTAIFVVLLTTGFGVHRAKAAFLSGVHPASTPAESDWIGHGEEAAGVEGHLVTE